MDTGRACLEQVLCPNLGLGRRLNPEPIIHGMAESLLASKIFLRSLDGYMTEKELDLLQLAS